LRVPASGRYPQRLQGEIEPCQYRRMPVNVVNRIV
jgi:hypothetical protein